MKKIIFLIIVIAIVSCQKATIDEVPVKNNSVTSLANVTSKDGRLIFKNKSDFNATVKMLFDNQKSIKNFESQFPGFTSNKQAFERIDSTYLKSINYNYDLISSYATVIETPEGKSLERVVDMHLLAYLFNDEGILQIGDSIFKFSYDFTYKFNVDKLSQLKSAKLAGSTNDVIAYPNIRSRIELPTTNLKSAQASVAELRKYYSSTKFMKCELNRNVTVLMNTITVDTKSRKDNFLNIGFAYSVYQLYCYAAGQFRVVGVNGDVNVINSFLVSQTRTGSVSDVQEAIWTGWYPDIPEFISGTTVGVHRIDYGQYDPIKPYEYTYYLIKPCQGLIIKLIPWHFFFKIILS